MGNPDLRTSSLLPLGQGCEEDSGVLLRGVVNDVVVSALTAE